MTSETAAAKRVIIESWRGFGACKKKHCVPLQASDDYLVIREGGVILSSSQRDVHEVNGDCAIKLLGEYEWGVGG